MFTYLIYVQRQKTSCITNSPVWYKAPALCVPNHTLKRLKKVQCNIASTMKRNQCTTTNKEYELYVLRECGLSCEDVPPEGLGGYTVHGLELRRLGRSFVYISFPFILKRSGK